MRARSEILFKIIAQRLLQMDALCKGWVMVNYPNTFDEFKKVIEELKIPPNKVIYLQCCETMALRRLLEKPSLGRPQDFCDYMKEEVSNMIFVFYYPLSFTAWRNVAHYSIR